MLCGIFGTKLQLRVKVSFNLTKAKKEILRGIIEQEAVNALVELGVWATLLKTKVSIGVDRVEVEWLGKGLFKP